MKKLLAFILLATFSTNYNSNIAFQSTQKPTFIFL